MLQLLPSVFTALLSLTVHCLSYCEMNITVAAGSTRQHRVCLQVRPDVRVRAHAVRVPGRTRTLVHVHRHCWLLRRIRAHSLVGTWATCALTDIHVAVATPLAATAALLDVTLRGVLTDELIAARTVAKALEACASVCVDGNRCIHE
jgi:hypothetical protein